MVVQTPIVTAARWFSKMADVDYVPVLETKSGYLKAFKKVTGKALFYTDLTRLGKAKEILDRHHGIVA